MLGFIEKPSLEKIYTHYGITGQYTCQVAAAGHQCRFLSHGFTCDPHNRPFAGSDDHAEKQFDIGGDLLPWLVENGYPVYCFQVGRMGDLGNIPSYLETMVDVLHGRFPSMTSMMPEVYPGSDHILIDAESLEMSDPISRLTLAEKLEQGLVELHPPVRIGKYVRIYPGVVLGECNIDDDCEVLEQSVIIRSSVGSGSLVGPYSHIEDTLTGIMVELQSSRDLPVSLQHFAAIGDEVVMRGGTALANAVTIYPRLKVPTGIRVPPNTEIESAEQMLEYM